MSSEQSPLEIAKQAERDLASSENNPTGNASRGKADFAQESGVDEAIHTKFPGSSVTVGSTGQGGGREIPESEGGSVDDKGRVTKARDFEGEGGPEDKIIREIEERGGDEGVGGNIKQ